jgi:hypothetical protein
MLEGLVIGYEKAFARGFREADRTQSTSVQQITKQASVASWETLAIERIEDASPTIPLGKTFWPVSKEERANVGELFHTEEMRELAFILKKCANSRRCFGRVTILPE